MGKGSTKFNSYVSFKIFKSWQIYSFFNKRIDRLLFTLTVIQNKIMTLVSDLKIEVKLKEVQSDECIVAFVVRFSTFRSFSILFCIILRDIILL